MKILSKFLAVAIVIVGIASVPQIAAHAMSTTSDTACINGDIRSNISVTWNSNTNVTVGTVGNKPLCNDESIYFSTYTMPDNYDGQGFQNGANTTATPQVMFASTHTVFAKGSTVSQTLTVAKPADCKNYQVDVYYGPELTNVTPAGHGKQYIDGRLLVKTVPTCSTTPPVTTTTPTPPATPAAPVAPVQSPTPEVTATPVELPHTGTATSGSVLIGLTLGIFTYAGAYLFNKKSAFFTK